MTTSAPPDYKSAAQKALQGKGIAELRLQACHINHNAACMEGNMELEQKCRAEAHALLDIIMDNNNVAHHCIRALLANGGTL